MKIFLLAAMILNLGIVCAEDKICKKDEICPVEGSKCEDPARPVYKDGEKDIKFNGKPGMKCAVIASNESGLKVCEQGDSGPRAPKADTTAAGTKPTSTATTGTSK